VDLTWAQQVLQEGSESSDVSTRRAAVAHLVALETQAGGGDWGAIGAFDPNPWVQRATIEVLAERLDEDRSRGLLEVVVSRSDLEPATRALAARALLEAEVTGVSERLEDCLSHPPWRAAPCALVLASQGDGDALEVLIQALNEGDLAVNLPFLEQVAESGLTELATPLETGLEWSEEEMQLAVAAALFGLGSRTGEEHLKKVLRSGTEERRMEVVDLIAEQQGPEAESLLRSVTTRDLDGASGLARAALVTRGVLPIRVALQMSSSEDREIRAAACDALGSATGSREQTLARRSLRDALSDPDFIVSITSIRALARIGQPSDRPFLAILGQSDVEEVRVEVAAALLLLTPAPS
jgi:HEAT repeat protein